MATRMTTLLYGEKLTAETAGKSVLAKDPDESGAHPRAPTVEVRAAVQPARPVALPTLMVGLAIVAIVFAGLALWSIAIAWSESMAPPAKIGLMVLGGYLLAIGITFLVSAPQREIAHAA
jgi:hypothetical protein